jgi:hypothetical protein
MIVMSEMSPNFSSRSKSDTASFGQKSSLYQEFLAEREEILRHKWIESEKSGKDIGFERALLDWIRHYREGWRQQRRGSSFASASMGEGDQRDQ